MFDSKTESYFCDQYYSDLLRVSHLCYILGKEGTASAAGPCSIEVIG